MRGSALSPREVRTYMAEPADCAAARMQRSTRAWRRSSASEPLGDRFGVLGPYDGTTSGMLGAPLLATPAPLSFASRHPSHPASARCAWSAPTQSPPDRPHTRPATAPPSARGGAPP